MRPRLVKLFAPAFCGAALCFPSTRLARAIDAPLPPVLQVAAEEPAAEQPAAVQMVSDQQLIPGIQLVAQPTTVDQPEEPVSQTPATQAGSGGFGGFLDLGSLSAERQQEVQSTAAADVVTGNEAEIRNTSDSSDLLVRSTSTTGVYVHSRNPISNDTRIRGFRFTQIRSHIHGAYWSPIRPDFDSPLSKLDSSLIKDVIITKGPYSVRQGPGFAFIDIELQDTLRSECGCGNLWAGRSAFVFDTNGGQFNARQTVAVGQENSGLRVGYGERGGSDYERGDGRLVAAGYHSRDWDLAYGYDFSPDSRFEFNYQRVDQTDVELPAQYFDIDGLVADGFSGRYTLENETWFDRLRVDAWWNRTRFSGNAANGTKPGILPNAAGAGGFPVLANNGNIGEVRSTGIRSAMTWGTPDCPQLTVGADYTFVDQEYIETADRFLGFFGLPRTVQDDLGLFADMSLPMTDRLTIRPGVRTNWNDTTPGGGLVAPGPNDVDRSFNLYMGNVSADYELNCVWTAKVSYGYGERAPSPTDLYTRTFLELLQPGGDLDFRGFGGLAKEKLNQIDVGLYGEFADARCGINGFVGWVEDYITYQFDGGVMETVNTDARLGGVEMFGEYDFSQDWTAFGAISYVQATDRIRDEPLWGIPPLDSRLGLRYQPGDWGVEFAVRIVDDQDRIAQSIFTSGGFTTSLAEQETPGFMVVDIRGFYKMREGVRLVGGVENVGDADYQEHLDARRDLSYGTPGGVFRPGINAYLGIIANY